MRQHKSNPDAKIIDITYDITYERYLYRCLAPMPFKKYKKRHEYLQIAVPKGLHKKLLISDGDVVGQIEYAPAEVSGYPITGKDIIVMNCIWVLRRAKGHNFGKHLVVDMIESERKALGFATIGLEGHWSGWLKKDQMEKLGFKAIDTIEVRHKTKHIGECFKICLMWLPKTESAKPPKWNKSKLLKGENFCMAHPLYHPEGFKAKEMFEKC